MEDVMAINTKLQIEQLEQEGQRSTRGIVLAIAKGAVPNEEDVAVLKGIEAKITELRNNMAMILTEL